MIKALLTCVLLCELFTGTARLYAAEGSDQKDFRILIDVSGSMQKSDPNNLRAPGLRLFVDLLPPGSQAGVWLFAGDVEPMLPLAKVNEAWKKLSRELANQIHSKGLFTHIESAIETSTAGWEAPTKSLDSRHVILLTDGVVDVSKEPGESETSRKRILSELLPRLKKSGVSVHTIALSENADHTLMRQLAHFSGGGYSKVKSASDLQRVFLRMFEKAVQPDTLPIKENRFNIDLAISEVTLLIFVNPDAPMVKIVRPDGFEFGHTDKPITVNWRSDKGYDLITMLNPAPGEWRIKADIDPDNRAIIVTDLKLKTSTVPNSLISGEPLSLMAQLNEQGERITSAKFLDLVDMHLIASNMKKFEWSKPVNDDGKGVDKQAGDGIFSIFVNDPIHEGLHDIVLTANSGTFVREKRFSVRTTFPLKINIQALTDKQTKYQLISVSSKPEYIDPRSLKLTVRVDRENEKPLRVEMQSEGTGDWVGRFRSEKPIEGYRVWIAFSARNIVGEEIRKELGPYSLDGSLAKPLPLPKQLAAKKVKNPTTIESEITTPLEKDVIDWFEVAWTVIGVNIIAIGVFWWLRKCYFRKEDGELLILDEAA